jgi:hypothetical protein
MIFTLIIYLFSFFISALVAMLPGWSLWPDILLTGVSYFCSCLAHFNFIFPVDTLFSVLLFLINFEILYFTSKLVIMFWNWIRGAGGINI